MTTEQGAGEGTQQPPEGQATDPWTDPTAARAEIERLRRESAGYRTKVRELEPLAAKATAAEEAQKTEAQKLTEQLAAAQAAAQTAQASALRYQVAAAKGLPIEFAARLQGATEEELSADADQLVTLLGGGQQQAPQLQQQGAAGARPQLDLRQGQRGTAPVNGEVDKNEWLRGVARSGSRRA